jgi:hypothetical protein
VCRSIGHLLSIGVGSELAAVSGGRRAAFEEKKWFCELLMVSFCEL